MVVGGTLADGRPVELTTLPISYGWMKMQNITAVPLNSLFFFDIPLTWLGHC